jgi:mannosyl-3-phosphoglycerate phosphatase
MQIVFTDLDGTLLNHEDYSFEAALPLIEELRHKEIPIIPVTSKTRQEVETLINKLGLNAPFVVENGSGIFIPCGYEGFLISAQEIIGNYVLVNLGCTYKEVRQGLRTVEKNLRRELKNQNIQLQGFGDLSIGEIQSLTNLSSVDAEQAKAREFTEPFIPPEGVPEKILEQVVEDSGFRVLLGGRFYHLLGARAGKGNAVDWLVKQYQASNSGSEITTIGLGDSPNDLEMLNFVDIPIVVPKKDGVHPKLKDNGWTVAPSPAPEGWAVALKKTLLTTV